jgi:hypothetical protein
MSRSTVPVRLNRLWWVGPLTVLASILGVLVVRIGAVAILHPDPRPISLGWGAPIAFTFILVSGAVGVFALMARLARHPLRTYRIVAVVVLLLSFLPDIAYAGSSIPGASWPVAIALMTMHVVAWGVTVTMLTKMSGVGNS